MRSALSFSSLDDKIITDGGSRLIPLHKSFVFVTCSLVCLGACQLVNGTESKFTAEPLSAARVLGRLTQAYGLFERFRVHV